MNPHKKILVITQWNYADALIQTYTLPYVKIIRDLNVFRNLYVVVLKQDINRRRIFRKDGIIFIELKDRGSLLLTWLGLFYTLAGIIRRKKITHLHPWCTPAGAIAVLLKRFINNSLHLTVDSFEPHAEAMVENQTWNKSGFKYKLLFYLEKLQARLADNLIFAAKGMQDYIAEKYHVSAKRFFVKPACVDLSLFKPTLNSPAEDSVTCIYAGKFGGIYLEDEVFEFVSCCYNYWGNKFCFLLLSNVTENYLQEKATKFNFPRRIIQNKFVPHQQVPEYMSKTDFAICPVKPVPSKKYCSPIKTGEYWASGLPVIITKDISDDSEIIEKNDIGFVLKQLNTSEYQKSISYIAALLQRPDLPELKQKIRGVAETHRNFKLAQQLYESVYA